MKLGQNPLTEFFSARNLKTTATAGVIKAYTGENPIINRQGDYTEISFTPAQIQKLQTVLNQWHSQEPGTVRVKFGSVLTPYYLKRYWYVIAGTIGAGILLGAMLKR